MLTAAVAAAADLHLRQRYSSESRDWGELYSGIRRCLPFS